MEGSSGSSPRCMGPFGLLVVRGLGRLVLVQGFIMGLIFLVGPVASLVSKQDVPVLLRLGPRTREGCKGLFV